LTLLNHYHFLNNKMLTADFIKLFK
jgi:hypothetical protein